MNGVGEKSRVYNFIHPPLSIVAPNSIKHISLYFLCFAFILRVRMCISEYNVQCGWTCNRSRQMRAGIISLCALSMPASQHSSIPLKRIEIRHNQLCNSKTVKSYLTRESCKWNTWWSSIGIFESATLQQAREKRAKIGLCCCCCGCRLKPVAEADADALHFILVRPESPLHTALQNKLMVCSSKTWTRKFQSPRISPWR